MKHQFYSSANGITRFGLKVSSIGNVYFPIPPIEEQKEIAQFLDQKVSKIDIFIERIKQQIDLLKEYHKALIFEAVIGKIDVRNHE